MPAAAVASVTPAIAGMSGTRLGASGETADVMRPPAELFLWCVGLRLIEALDLGLCAQLGDELGLRLADHVGLELVLDLVELGDLALALVLELDDVPAELRLHRIGDLAFFQLEGRRGEFRHHLVFGEIAEIAALRGARILRLL